jgi:hypothetical protein
MTIDAPIRTRLIDKIQQMPENKLQGINRFLEELQDTIEIKEVMCNPRRPDIINTIDSIEE